MDQQALSEALDRALTKVTQSELKRLRYGLGQSEWSEKIQNTLEALRLLQQGTPPNYYDPWVALFYTIWYQPGQIQLARLVIEKLRDERKTRSLVSNNRRGLRVIDFGCGALAMQFAVAITASELAEDGIFTSPIHVDSYDDSTAMVEIGKALWDQFVTEVEKDPRLSVLAVISNFIESRYSTGMYLSYSEQFEEERWLSGLHVAYSSNVDKIQGHLSSLVDSYNPHVGLVTSHADPDSIDRLRQASPFEGLFFNSQDSRLSPRENRILPNVTLLRRMLNAEMITGHNFLNGDVDWGFRTAWCKIYTEPF